MMTAFDSDAPRFDEAASFRCTDCAVHRDPLGRFEVWISACVGQTKVGVRPGSEIGVPK